jgi:hypothetical protein
MAGELGFPAFRIWAGRESLGGRPPTPGGKNRPDFLYDSLK